MRDRNTQSERDSALDMGMGRGKQQTHRSEVDTHHIDRDATHKGLEVNQIDKKLLGQGKHGEGELLVPVDLSARPGRSCESQPQ